MMNITLCYLQTFETTENLSQEIFMGVGLVTGC